MSRSNREVAKSAKQSNHLLRGSNREVAKSAKQGNHVLRVFAVQIEAVRRSAQGPR